MADEPAQQYGLFGVRAGDGRDGYAGRHAGSVAPGRRISPISSAQCRTSWNSQPMFHSQSSSPYTVRPRRESGALSSGGGAALGVWPWTNTLTSGRPSAAGGGGGGGGGE